MRVTVCITASSESTILGESRDRKIRKCKTQLIFFFPDGEFFCVISQAFEWQSQARSDDGSADTVLLE